MPSAVLVNKGIVVLITYISVEWDEEASRILVHAMYVATVSHCLV